MATLASPAVMSLPILLPLEAVLAVLAVASPVARLVVWVVVAAAEIVGAEEAGEEEEDKVEEEGEEGVA